MCCSFFFTNTYVEVNYYYIYKYIHYSPTESLKNKLFEPVIRQAFSSHGGLYSREV